jgi:hypothetical protein
MLGRTHIGVIVAPPGKEPCMRFHWFHLMPYPFLPDDFKQKYRSVWVDLPDALARENTQRFAQDVMPSLKGLWSEYEDHWYPAHG